MIVKLVQWNTQRTSNCARRQYIFGNRYDTNERTDNLTTKWINTTTTRYGATQHGFVRRTPWDCAMEPNSLDTVEGSTILSLCLIHIHSTGEAMVKQLAICILLSAAVIGCTKTEKSEMSDIKGMNHDASMKNDAAMNHDASMKHDPAMCEKCMNGGMQDMNKMMTERLGQSDAEYDHRFIDMMIPHHEAALSMAKDAQQKAQHPEMKKLADDIIAAQQREIDMMKKWRDDWYKH